MPEPMMATFLIGFAGVESARIMVGFKMISDIVAPTNVMPNILDVVSKGTENRRKSFPCVLRRPVPDIEQSSVRRWVLDCNLEGGLAYRNKQMGCTRKERREKMKDRLSGLGILMGSMMSSSEQDKVGDLRHEDNVSLV